MINHLKNMTKLNEPQSDTQEEGVAMVNELVDDYGRAFFDSLPQLVSEEVITVKVMEYDNGSRAYFVDGKDIPSARLNDLLQDLHLKRNHKNTGIS